MYPMATTSVVHVRLDRKVKGKAEKALAAMGAALEDARRGGLRSFRSVDDLMADLNASGSSGR